MAAYSSLSPLVFYYAIGLWTNLIIAGLDLAGKAYLSGTKPDVAGDPKVHGKVGN